MVFITASARSICTDIWPSMSTGTTTDFCPMARERYRQLKHLRANDCFINNQLRYQLRRDMVHVHHFSDVVKYAHCTGSKNGADSRIRTDTGSPLERISPHRYPSPACIPLPPYPLEVKTVGVGFEPTDLRRSPDLKSGALNQARPPHQGLTGRAARESSTKVNSRGPLFTGCRISPQPGMSLPSVVDRKKQFPFTARFPNMSNSCHSR